LTYQEFLLHCPDCREDGRCHRCQNVAKWAVPERYCSEYARKVHLNEECLHRFRCNKMCHACQVGIVVVFGQESRVVEADDEPLLRTALLAHGVPDMQAPLFRLVADADGQPIGSTETGRSVWRERQMPHRDAGCRTRLLLIGE